MNPKRCIWILFLLLVTVVPAPFPLRAEEASVGLVTKVEGTAAIIGAEGGERPALREAELFAGDTLTTGEDGVVCFSFHNGDVFRLNEEAQVSVDELSASDEDTPPVLQLTLGFLWSRIRQILPDETREVIHTPTAVCGVRGTEFDTVVAEDSSTALAVDEGVVEVQADEKRQAVGKGQETEVDAQERIRPPFAAVPREQRDWKGFRRERAKRLLKDLPESAPRIRRRFERTVERYVSFSRRVRASADGIQTSIRAFQRARQERDRARAGALLREIQSRERTFRTQASRFRRAFNRVRVIGKSTFHVTKLFERNRDRYRLKERDVIETNLAAVSEPLRELRRASRETVAKIKSVYGELRGIRRMIEKQGKRPLRPPGGG